MVSAVAHQGSSFAGCVSGGGFFDSELEGLALNAQLSVLRSINPSERQVGMQAIGRLIDLCHLALKLKGQDQLSILRGYDHSLTSCAQLLEYFTQRERLGEDDLIRRIGRLANQLIQLKKTGRIDEAEGLELARLFEQIQYFAAPDRPGCF